MTLLHDGISSLYCIDQPTRDVVSVHVVDEVDKAEEGCCRPLALQRWRHPLPQAHPAYCELLYYNFTLPLVISEFHYE